MNAKLRRLAPALVALALSLVVVIHALWIPLKAEVAQLLVHDAWARARHGIEQPRPWPWADTWPVARLISEQHDVDLYVLAGASGSSLAFGPGHVDGTALPGEPGNAAVGGHRDTSFAFLERVQLGDVVQVETPAGELVRYAVVETAIVDERDTRALHEEPGRMLTLITCWPFHALAPGGSDRYVVRALEVPLAPEAPFTSSAPALVGAPGTT
ncbi:MAG: class GN sortase [Deltaproteobacteria bacterium]|nr:class GN sortase [Deltaproteobacteria bacterium]